METLDSCVGIRDVRDQLGGNFFQSCEADIFARFRITTRDMRMMSAIGGNCKKERDGEEKRTQTANKVYDPTNKSSIHNALASIQETVQSLNLGKNTKRDRAGKGKGEECLTRRHWRSRGSLRSRGTCPLLSRACGDRADCLLSCASALEIRHAGKI